MFLLALCLIGTAMAAPAIPEAPLFKPETHMLVSPYIAYPAPILPLRTLEVMIEPEPKEEKEELAEPKEEFKEPEEFKEELKEEFLEPPAAPELPKLEEPKPIEPIVVKLDVPKPPSFISNWISSLPISLPNISLPGFISNWFPSLSSKSPKVLYSPYYSTYPGAVIVEAPKL